MKSILVTGGNGYKGTVLIPKLLNRGYKVRSIDTNWFGDYLKEHPNLEKIKLDIRNIKQDLFDFLAGKSMFYQATRLLILLKNVI